jgi:hypothetical protein
MIPGDPRPHKQVLKAECIAEYEAARTDIYRRLVHINTSIQILESIASFPLGHLVAPDDPFFATLYGNFIYTAVVMLHALLEGTEPFGIPRFKNRLARDWLPEREQAPLRDRLHAVGFSATAQRIKLRVAAMRDKIIAHRDSEVVTHLLKVSGVTIGDLRMLYNEAEALFGACCFAVEYETTLYTRGTVGGRPIKRDIERFMSLLLKDSEWLRQPERDGQWWPEMRRLMPQADLDELNRWRVRVDLPEA